MGTGGGGPWCGTETAKSRLRVGGVWGRGGFWEGCRQGLKTGKIYEKNGSQRVEKPEMYALLFLLLCSSAMVCGLVVVRPRTRASRLEE